MKQSLIVVLRGCRCWRNGLWGIALMAVSLSVVLADIDSKWYAVEVSAAVQNNPAQIRLQWERDTNATSYGIFRKAARDTGWTVLASVGGSTSQFADPAVNAGTAYEYQVMKQTSAGYKGFGYVMAGIEAPLVEDRGTVILIVDSTYAADLTSELSRLQQDLVGDGWTVVRHDVSRTDSVMRIKQLIVADYNADPARVRSVFLFGHVAVPYSGNLAPDNHGNHQGAWPADVFYGDVDGTWTDSAVSNVSAELSRNYNVPGDGKFDQNEIPSAVELEVGRVDLSNMTTYSNKSFSRSERDLLRQYLNKDHNFRHKLFDLPRRGLVCDNFGSKNGEAFAASGWRNFAAFFGAANVQSVAGRQYFSTLNQTPYLWSYGCGGGSYYTCDGIGSSDDFATGDIQSVFTMFLGSYFGDWDNESNFLRAPLGSTSYCLVSVWAGRPHWFVHPMGLGETIGYCARLTQNNGFGGLYEAQNIGTHGIHVALMGDPTLRLHSVAPATAITATPSQNGVGLAWGGSPDTDLAGYHVYRSLNAGGPFVRVTGANPIVATTFADVPSDAGTYTYMVRAIKLEKSSSGTYYNPSEGIFQTVQVNADGSSTVGGGIVLQVPQLPQIPAGLKAIPASSTEVELSWLDGDSSLGGFKVERAVGAAGAYQTVTTLSSVVLSYRDAQLAPGLYRYRVRAFNAVGDSPASSEVSAQLDAAPIIPASGTTAVFLQTDTSTRGDWKGIYGADGSWVAGDARRLPNYAQVTIRNGTQFTWSDSPSDPRALQRSSRDGRVAGCWFAPDRVQVDVGFTDGQAHLVALYFLDWDTTARSEQIEVLDSVTGATLDQRSLSNFDGGTYLLWQISGKVTIRCTHLAGNNALVTGIFFGRTSGQLNNDTGSAVLSLSRRASGGMQVRIAGQPSQKFVIHYSGDLQNWTTVGTVTLNSTVGYLDDPDASNAVRRYYRAVLQN